LIKFFRVSTPKFTKFHQKIRHSLFQWFSNFLARGTLKETKIFSRHTQVNFDRKTVIFRLVEKKFAAPFEFLTAPQSAAAHSLKTTGLFEARRQQNFSNKTKFISHVSQQTFKI
jgi:hypothetical protein